MTHKKTTAKKPAKAKAKPRKSSAKPATKKPAVKPKTRAAESVPSTTTDYDRFRDQQAQIARDRSKKGRDIGAIPDIADPDRRESCRLDFRRFCETYNPAAFALGWSPDQIRAAERMQEVILLGALYAFAEPRGNGKTTRCRMAVLWAVSYGHWRFPVLIGAENGKAIEGLDAIKTYMRYLPTYTADFPEISHAARALDGIAQRAGGQLCNGELTQIEWGQNRIILPTMRPPKNWPANWPLRADGMVPTSGSIVDAVGLTADGIRGTSVTLSTGENLRPDGVIIDDPQTPESARSPTQNATRERLVSADVLGMAGPGKTIAGMMPCTIIYPGDFIDRMTDRAKHPLWRGERTKMLPSMPTNLDEWDKYFDVYRECALREPPDFTAANDYYIEHRAILDEGAVAGWDERFSPGEVSAIQHAMHIYFRDPRAFASEYQNAPESDIDLTESRQLSEDDLARKLNQQPRGIVPRGCNRLTAFVDVQSEVLFWTVCGWTDKFGGALVDYGAYPSQTRDTFTAADPTRKLSTQFPNMDRAPRIYAGLLELIPKLLGTAYRQQESDGVLTVVQGMIDAGFETDAVHEFIQRSPLKAMLKPSKGKGVGAASKPMNDYRKEPNDLMGWNWRIDAKTQGKGRFVSFDTNAWKTKIAEAILAPPAAHGSFYLPGGELRQHPLLVTHLLSEYRTPTFGQGRRVEEWRPRPDQRENHWWDCIVGCAVAASVSGLSFSAAAAAGEPDQPKSQKPKLSLREEQDRKLREFQERQRTAR